MSTSIAIMQPYFLPYLGYFHLMHSVDKFVIYDDIEYTKQSWINRNRLLFGDKVEYITLPISKNRDHIPVNERCIAPQWQKDKDKYRRKIAQHYSNRDNQEAGLLLYDQIVNCSNANLFNFLHHSIIALSEALKLETEIITSSKIGDFREYKGADKVKQICQTLNAERYINAIGGTSLYNKQDFSNNGIELKFVQSDFIPYDQKRADFVAGLSIIDLIMSVSDQEEIRSQLNSYQLI